MGLFGFGKKKYDKNISRDNEFLKDYAIKVNGLIIFIDDNDKVKAELNQLKDDFQYAVGSTDPKAKAIEKNIKRDFDELAAKLQQPTWDEAEVLMLVKVLRRSIVEISALR